jgi:signal transduction histidine kinase
MTSVGEDGSPVAAASNTLPLRPRHRRRRPHIESRWWLNVPIRFKGLLVVALPLVTIALTIIVRLPSTRQQQATAALLAQAEGTRHSAQELLIAMLEVEGGLRGYLLTADREFLVRFENARDIVPQHVDRLETLFARSEDRRRFEEVSSLVQQQLDLSATLVSSSGAAANVADPAVQARLADERHVMDRLRESLGELRTTQDSLVAQHQAELDRLERQSAPVARVTFFGGLAAAVAAGWLFATSIGARIQALERNAGRLAAGERLRSETSRGNDEIGSLDHALRRASVLLRARDREVRAVQAKLEQTVHEQVLLNRELEAFSYSVSHDLRAPLRSIDGFAQALREDWGDRLDETAQDQLARVRNAAQKMGRLIDDLLKLARLTRSQIQRSEVNLSRLAQEVCHDLTERNPTRDVTWAIAGDLHAWCDPALARILLENLLGNAWKFTSKTADARIEFSRVPEIDPPVFVVRDNGAGFDMRYVEKLFAPFQRLHSDREFPGTGIGLATVQRIVRKHGGEVRPQAAVGHGAAFFFSFDSSDYPWPLPASGGL